MTVPDLQLTTVLIATAVAFVLSATYYGLLFRSAAVDGVDSRSPWLMPIELARTLVMVTVVAVLAGLIGVRGWGEGAVLGVGLWAGFPLVLWAGAMLHEGTPWRLAALHGGDWLVKLVVTGVIVAM